MPETIAAPTPETFSIKVLTRHSGDCDHRDDSDYKKCNCRKSVYLYEHGKVRYISAKTRSWAKAEEFMRILIDARDPVKKALLEIEDRERAKAEAEQASRVRIDSALETWFKGLAKASRSRSVQFASVVKKLKSWAGENGFEYLDEIKPTDLSEWRAEWSPKATNKRDKMSPATQNQYISLIRRFFRWVVKADYLDKDLSRLMERAQHKQEPTQPLTPEQFAQVMTATHKLDADRNLELNVPEFGRDLRAIFLLQRWTGIRLGDALSLRRTDIRNGALTLTTKKTGAPIKNRKLPQVLLDALAAIPTKQEHVRPGYYFWGASCGNADNLTTIWAAHIRDLNKYLSLRDEHNKKMKFRSHMLRDTFAVELLLSGMALEDVSHLLTHTDIKTTHKHYAKWVETREEKLAADVKRALEGMGAEFAA